MIRRFIVLSAITAMGMAAFAPNVEAGQTASRSQVRPTRSGRINCVINKRDVKIRSLGPNRVMINGKLKVINTSYRYTYDAGADVHVFTNRQIKHRVLHGRISPRHYRYFHFHFVLSIYPPSTTVHWKVKRCGLY